MILEVAIGDAYGSGFEFVPNEVIEKENNLEKYYGSRIDNLKAGQYTDDTQMTLAIAELMLSKEEWTKKNIIKYFLKTFKRDKRKGYAKGFYHFLMEIKTPNEFKKKIINNSIRNGAAMRSVPIGLYPSINEVLTKSKLQAQTTHDTKEGIVSSQAVALMSYYFINNIGNKNKLKEFIELHTESKFNHNYTERVPCDGMATIDAVLTVLMSSSSYKEILKKSIDLGGDTDSVASIALGVASFSSEYNTDLPLFLVSELENDKYGLNYILKLDEKLMKKFNIKEQI